ncbi:hypothetical protein EDB83DRAFT_2390108 [Lactarius deliciosus]|nr:hypothetical protein EDB83DRAFT_2390108 [Lactarius deliciosus]
MHSHKTLALLALAASTASPALAAPVLRCAGGGIGGILKTIGTGLGFGALPVVLQDALGGNSTRRDTPHIIVDGLPVPIGPIVPSDTIPSPTPPAPIPTPTAATPILVDGFPVHLNSRGIGSAFGDLLDGASTSSIGKVLSDGLLSGVASAAGAVGAGSLLNHTRREPGLGSAVSSILNAVKTTDPIGSVISNGLLGGVASGAGAVGLNSLLNNTRRDGESHALVRNGVPPQLTAKDLISALNVVARRLAELD